MKQFGIVLQFELKHYFKNKIFVGVTVFLMLVIAGVMFLPQIIDAFSGSDSNEDVSTTDGEHSVMLIKADEESIAETVLSIFPEVFTEYDVTLFEGSREELSGEILNGDAAAILSIAITHETESLGKDQLENYWYTYIMIFALYMVILLYGQMVATSVATEKSSRAMELLVTSTKPVSMMFGKVIAACLAGFVQLVCVFGSAILFYNTNRTEWGTNEIIGSIFNMPGELLAFMLLFFVLGFFIYAFMFGAVGSTASRLEDINTSVMPITMLFVIAFMVVMFSMSSSNVDNTVMVVCSYIPFTSPMAMFARIAMSTVPAYEIVLSVAILIASVSGVGVLSAKIYRVGVLLYGTTPKMRDVIKSVWKT